jgi:hypothetical protein
MKSPVAPTVTPNAAHSLDGYDGKRIARVQLSLCSYSRIGRADAKTRRWNPCIAVLVFIHLV